MTISRDATSAVCLPDGRTIYVAHFSETDVAIPIWEGAAPGWRWHPEGIPMGCAPKEKWSEPFETSKLAVADALTSTNMQRNLEP